MYYEAYERETDTTAAGGIGFESINLDARPSVVFFFFNQFHVNIQMSSASKVRIIYGLNLILYVILLY